MILTDRELFLLIICTVFYITLFILVIQNNRRKLQLLQSRLDNIHAMQKMAGATGTGRRQHLRFAHLSALETVSERRAQHDGARLEGADGHSKCHLHRLY